VQKNFESRKFIVLSIFILVAAIYILRLFYIQVIDDSYLLSANNQALRHLTQYPARGLVYDRKGKLLSYNEASYNLMVIPKEVDSLDTLSFCQLTSISIEDFRTKMQKAKKYSSHKASIFEPQIPADQFATISEKIYKFPGFFGQKRSLRNYPEKTAAHVLGFVSEVNNRDLEKDNYYKKGDYIGANGIEKFYEKDLRGAKGKKVVMVDVFSRIQGKYKNGKYDTLAVPGKNLTLSLDIELQNFGEQLMQNKRGSIVAIEPSTGEILALVSAPNYDPNLLVGRVRSKNYTALIQNDSLTPLFNRALMAPYPPGSIYKMIQALIGLQEGVISTNTGFTCNKSLVGCHNHPHPDNLEKAIQFSCNPYFYETFKKIIQQGKYPSIFKDAEEGMINWKKHMTSFGLGYRLQIDQPNIKGGYIPTAKFYDKWYGHHRWAFSTIYSISIGQGEVSVIPLQMANLAAIIANRGYFITPHLFKSIEGVDTIPSTFTDKHYTTIDYKHYNVVVDAMQQVVEADHGTARRARIDSIEVCGKTGTAENPHGDDHSVFIAFAPKDNPKIAIAVYVENAGYGGTWAAPIASLIMEKYLKDSIASPKKAQRIFDANFLHLKDTPKK
jgi:penicillin-binding protein 2